MCKAYVKIYSSFVEFFRLSEYSFNSFYGITYIIIIYLGFYNSFIIQQAINSSLATLFPNFSLIWNLNFYITIIFILYYIVIL